MTKKYFNKSLTVIGGGPGGYVAALRAANLGYSVTLIEADALGGVCLNWGCIPSKALLKSAETFSNVLESEKYGVDLSVDLFSSIFSNHSFSAFSDYSNSSSIHSDNFEDSTHSENPTHFDDPIHFEDYIRFNNSTDSKDSNNFDNLTHASYSIDSKHTKSTEPIYLSTNLVHQFNIQNAVSRSRDVVKNLNSGIKGLLSKAGVKVLYGFASFTEQSSSQLSNSSTTQFATSGTTQFAEQFTPQSTEQTIEQFGTAPREQLNSQLSNSSNAQFTNASSIKSADLLNNPYNIPSHTPSNRASSHTSSNYAPFDYTALSNFGQSLDSQNKTNSHLGNTSNSTLHINASSNSNNNSQDIHSNNGDYQTTPGTQNTHNSHVYNTQTTPTPQITTNSEQINLNQPIKLKVKINDTDEERLIESDYVIVATGSNARNLNPQHFDKLDQNMLWTARDAMTSSEIPANLVVIGGGAIGLEFASFYNAVGRHKTQTHKQHTHDVYLHKHVDISQDSQDSQEFQGHNTQEQNVDSQNAQSQTHEMHATNAQSNTTNTTNSTNSTNPGNAHSNTQNTTNATSTNDSPTANPEIKEQRICKVTVIEMQSRILPTADMEVSKQAQKSFESRGIEILTDVKIKSIADGKVILDNGQEIAANKVLVSIGVTANTQGLSINNTHINENNGFIQVNDVYETNHKGIFAIGDVIGHPCLAHKASHEGISCIEQIALQDGIFISNLSDISDSSHESDYSHGQNSKDEKYAKGSQGAHNSQNANNPQKAQSSNKKLKKDLEEELNSIRRSMNDNWYTRYLHDKFQKLFNIGFNTGAEGNGIMSESSMTHKTMTHNIINSKTITHNAMSSNVISQMTRDKTGNNKNTHQQYDRKIYSIRNSRTHNANAPFEKISFHNTSPSTTQANEHINSSQQNSSHMSHTSHMNHINQENHPNYTNYISNNMKNTAPIPMCVYTFPQVAFIGITEEQAKKKEYDYSVGKFPFMANGKSLAIGEQEGFVKVIVDKTTGKILGAHMVGCEVTELISNFSLAMSCNITADKFLHAIFPHPTLSEAIAETMMSSCKKPIHF